MTFCEPRLNRTFRSQSIAAGYVGYKIGCMAPAKASVRRRPAVNLKNALIAVTAAVALLGAALVAVPTTGDRPIHDKLFSAKSPR